MSAAPWTATVTAPAGADLRTHPDMRAAVIRTIVHGDALAVHGCPCGLAMAWYAVTYGAQSGYVLVSDVEGSQ